MSAKAFFDTNVLIYAFAVGDPHRERAMNLVAAGGLISVQVLNEFINVSRRKLGYDWAEIIKNRSVLFMLLEPPIPLSLDLHDGAVTLARRYGYSIYDALILAAGLQAGCDVLYSEDMQHAQAIGGMTIRNPFV
jgi:predicted nucleic acid-binding protein